MTSLLSPLWEQAAQFSLNAMGWITDRAYGNSRQILGEKQGSAPGLFLPDKNLLLTNKIPNYGRFNEDSKKTCLTVALALNELGLRQDGSKHKIGIIGFGSCGSLKSDTEYFMDFLKYGETTGRSNTFLYTLPTSPLAEAAIYFGLMGPLFYMSRETNLISEAVNAACRIIADEDADEMLIGTVEDCCIYMVLGPKTENTICDCRDIDWSIPREELISTIIKLRNVK